MPTNQYQAEAMGTDDPTRSWGGMRRPYGDVQGMDGNPVPMGAGITPGERAAKALDALAPDMRAMLVGALGSDPMIASAFLDVLGPEYAQLIQKALKEQGQMMMDQSMGGAGMIAPPAPMGMMEG